MKRAVNYLRGTVRVSVSGAFPERVINLCAQNDVEFWAVEWRGDGGVDMTIRRRGLAPLIRFAEKVDCAVETRDRRGLPEFALKFRRRYGFLVGLALSLCVVGVLSRFVLTIEVTGNDRIPDAVILQHLQRRGVFPGAYGPGLDRRQIEQEILRDLDDLAWITINLNGTRVTVQVMEVRPVPERIDESGVCHIVAEADGIILGVEPELGDALVKEGDTVAKGEILISGVVTLEPPIYSDLPERYRYVHARGRVSARTWRQLSAVIPEQVTVKSYTGRDKTSLSVNFLGRRTEIFGNSSIQSGFYDRITSVRQTVLPGGIRLPLWLIREDCREYEPTVLSVDPEAAAELLEHALTERLKILVGDDGEVIRIDFETRIADGMICVTATGECLEEIGTEVVAESNSVYSGDTPNNN